MTTKTPALSTQLKTAKAEIKTLEEKVVKLSKELENTTSYKETWYKKSNELEKEIESVLYSYNFLEKEINTIRDNQPTIIEQILLDFFLSNYKIKNK